jgi:hypothetical protein
MPRKAKQVRVTRWLCVAVAALGLIQAAYFGFLEGEWLATLPLMPGVLAGLAVAWWLPRAFDRYGEQHWLFNCGVLLAKLLRRAR